MSKEIKTITSFQYISTGKLIGILGLCNYTFYDLRRRGIIPAPKVRLDGIRRHYTQKQVEEITKTVVALRLESTSKSKVQ